ncbi:MAG: ABC transporter ATP-binding protein, partial [Verrucomicrobia bacterium]|nr:ABC transporter ATP-binding protein [Verrucomicrobiota bacterium]
MPRPQSFKESIPGLWRVLRHFWPETRKHYWLILGSSLALLGEVLFRLLEPWPLKVVFDRVIHRMHGADGYRVTFLDIFDPVTLLT